MPGHSSNNNLGQTSGRNGAARRILLRLHGVAWGALALAALGCSSTEDRSLLSPMDAPLPEQVASGKEPYLVVGAVAGGIDTKSNSA